ncbi:MAG: hypothetical protein CSA61_01230 [Neptuniibacter caesariensis]|uniref:Uncharacterized protein n=1 Tax=Neptuniibacter caesariensis TaxID=207954 RepID=A0A2G6JDH0_NEPCE|nr:MAG: hypothetical protein CSA61_01230 [Neptuniibacter caesariensis]
MLRDLEQRNERPVDVPGNQPHVKAAQYIEPDESGRKSGIVLWLIAAFLIGVALWLWDETYFSKPPALTVQVAENPVPETARARVGSGVQQGAQPQIAETNTQVERPSLVKQNAIQKPLTAIPVIQARSSIQQIKWAGADFGGDLVVRLKGDADIQVLYQQDNVIAIAFENVELETALPIITSPLISSLDVDAEGDRIILTLATQVRSQFAFRVQQNPTSVVVGVVPEERVFNAEADITAETQQRQTQQSAQKVPHNEGAEAIAMKPVSPAEPPSEAVSTPIKSGTQLQVNTPPPTDNDSASITRKPVSKAKTILTDKQRVVQAQQLIDKGELGRAEDLLREAIQEKPGKVPASRSLLATLLLSTGAGVKAQSVIADGLDRHPRDGALKKLQARIWLSEGQYSKAVDLLKRGQPGIVNDPEYHELLATAYQQQAQPEVAARIYYQLLQHNSQVPRWWIGLGYAMEQDKRYTDALNAYQSGLQIPTIAPNLKSYARQRVKALMGQ